MASLLAGLVQYHEWLAADIIDAALEDTRLGMEINNAKYNQRRTAVVRFLGEIYNYRCHSSTTFVLSLTSLIHLQANRQFSGVQSSLQFDNFRSSAGPRACS